MTTSARSFGRRGNARQARLPAKTAPQFQEAAGAPVEPAKPEAAQIAPGFIDSELEEWKKARKFTIPWRQLSLMASLCFGIASLILPHSVNDLVQWPLYALAAASFYAGVSKRRRQRSNAAQKSVDNSRT